MSCIEGTNNDSVCARKATQSPKKNKKYISAMEKDLRGI